MILPFKELYNKKKSHIAVFLGSGASVNDITEEQWSILTRFDLWAVNNWVYHPFIVPDFYHIEVKKYDALIVKERLTEKWSKYKNVNFVIPKPKGEKSLVLDTIGHEKQSKIYTYDFNKRGAHPLRSSAQIIDANYDVKSPILIKSYDASVTLLIDMLYKFGYKHIILVGVDLSDSRYFWTGGDSKVYGRVHHQWNKQHEGKSPNSPHNTFHVIYFIVDFNNRHMKPNRKEIFIQSKKSLLYKYMRHIEI